MRFGKNNMRVSLAVLVMGLSAVTTQAALVGLDADTAAIPGFHGLTEFDTVDSIGISTNGDVDIYYAVYAPGTDFSLTALGSAPAGVDTANEYVYAYQLHNKTLPNVIFGATGALSIFTIGFGDDTPALPGQNGFNEFEDRGLIGAMPSADVAPTSVQFDPPTTDLINDPSSAVWNFDASGAIPSGGISQVLFFSSEDAPEFDTTVAGGDFWPGGTTVGVPSPAPEPASLVLMLAGSVTVLARKRRHEKV